MEIECRVVGNYVNKLEVEREDYLDWWGSTFTAISFMFSDLEAPWEAMRSGKMNNVLRTICLWLWSKVAFSPWVINSMLVDCCLHWCEIQSIELTESDGKWLKLPEDFSSQKGVKEWCWVVLEKYLVIGRFNYEFEDCISSRDGLCLMQEWRLLWPTYCISFSTFFFYHVAQEGWSTIE